MTMIPLLSPTTILSILALASMHMAFLSSISFSIFCVYRFHTMTLLPFW